MLGEPTPSPYDWRFTLMGFPVRIHWLFWVITAALGYNMAMGANQAFSRIGTTPGIVPLLLVWILCVMASVLVHELGHAIAFRYYGIESSIVLYAMGGLAIPTAGFSFNRSGTRRRLTHANHVVISLAGPFLQFASAIVVAGLAYALGFYVPTAAKSFEWLTPLGISNPWANEGLSPIRDPWTFAIFEFYVLVSIWWPLFNLLPVYPLDGGHVVQHTAAILRRSDGYQEAHMIGAAFGFLVAWWFFQRGSSINALLFVSLAMNNVQALQRFGGPPRW
jgi:membrane-associated protease RseP (regulator of RpoE activity)